MTKPMKTVDLPSGHVGHNSPKEPTMSDTPEAPKPVKVKVKLTPEEYAAGKTPNSGKLKKDGTPVPGQSPEADARRAAERAAEAAGGDVPDSTPEPTDPPVVP